MARNFAFKFALGLLLFPVLAWASPPSRSFTYVINTTISPTDVTTNEDNIYTYLQNGVDTYFAGSIVNADISASAAIADSKLAQITTAGKVSNTSLTGIIPVTLLPVGTSTSQVLNFTTLNVGTGAGQVLQLNVTGNVPLASIPGLDSSILTSGTIPTARLGTGTANNTTYLKGDGTWGRISQFFNVTSSWIAPPGVTTVIVTLAGAGGGGGGGNLGTPGGGGGSGGYAIKVPISVTPLSSYTVTIGLAGAQGASESPGYDGGDGGYSEFTGDNSWSIRANGGGKGYANGTGGLAGSADIGGRITFAGVAGSNYSGNAGGTGASGVYGLGTVGGSINSNAANVTNGYGSGGGGGGKRTGGEQNLEYGGAGGTGFALLEW